MKAKIVFGQNQGKTIAHRLAHPMTDPKFVFSVELTEEKC